MHRAVSSARFGWRPASAALSASLLPGCARAPSLSVVGAYFPGWLFCMAGALILTLIVRGLLAHVKEEQALGPSVVVNSLMYVMFSLLLWLIFF